MKRRIRTLPTTEPYLKFLKPGALAQLRDSRISARSHSVTSIPLLRSSPPPSPSSNTLQSQTNTMDDFPCFSGRIFGPRCLQRKKLVAAKSVMFLNSRPSSSESDSPDPIINLLNNDSIVVAH